MATAATTKTRKPAAAKTAKPTKTERALQEVKTFTSLPKRQYTLNRPAKHAEFFQGVRDANVGLSGDERVWQNFPAPSKGVAAAIKRGVYAAIAPGEFVAVNRKIDGEDYVLVTVADQPASE